jgi:hypothetical protein
VIVGVAEFHESCKTLRSADDAKLSGYYVVTPAVQGLAAFESNQGLAIGLKGIGKTAAYRYLAEFDTKTPDIIVGIDSNKYSLYLTNKDLKYDACRKQFRHDLVLEGLRAFSDSSKAVRERIAPSVAKAAAKQVKSYTAMLGKLKANLQGMNISILGSGFTLPLASQSPVAIGLRTNSEIESALETLKAICDAGIRIRIVIDDPENVFSATNELDVPLVGGLCLAALELAKLIPNLKVIVLLKTHVYYPVLSRVDDLRGYPDHIGRLSWNEERLTSVVQGRLRWTGTKWTDVFTGSESEARTMVQDMCRKVRNGPRDLLRWMDLTLQLAGGGKVSKSTVEKARKKSSLDALAELEAAHAETYPKIGAVLRIVFRGNGDRNFALHELRKTVEGLWLKDPEMMALTKLPWMQRESAFTLPELFFRVGALALCNGKHPVLPYEDEYDVATFESCSHLSLVPALTESLK